MRMQIRLSLGLLAMTIAVCWATSDAAAQSGSRAFGGRGIYDEITSRPTVSPYLNLINPNPSNFDSSVGRYQSLVRPQLNQRARNQATRQQLRGLQNQVQQIQSTALGPVRNGGGLTPQVFATGHPSVFQYYSHFYPGRR